MLDVMQKSNSRDLHHIAFMPAILVLVFLYTLANGLALFGTC